MAYKNPEDKKKYNKIYYERTKHTRRDPEHLETQMQYRERTKEQKKEYDRVYAQNNKSKKNAACARRRARLLNQCPPDADMELIQEIYDNRPEGHHVDHIVALANGGLHHEDNLQYLTASENCSKGDR